MTVPTIANPISYTGDNTTAVYAYTWRILQDSDIQVEYTTPLGVTSTLALNTDYTVDGVLSYTGGNVTLLAGNLITDAVLLLTRNPAAVQDTDLQNQGQYNAKVIENALDRLTMIDQSLQQQIDDVTIQLPTPSALDLLQWKADLSGLQNLPIADLSPILLSENFIVDRYIGGVDYTAGVTTALTLSQAPGTVNNVEVLFDGVSQQDVTFSLAAAVITFDAVIPVGVLRVQIKQAGVLPLSIPADNSVGSATLQVDSVTTPKIPDDAVTTPKIPDLAITIPKLAVAVTDLIADGASQVGDGKLWFVSAIPAKWLACDGSSKLRASYPALFAVIGTVWGSVDGTHFTLPDLRGRAPIGVGTGSGLTPRALAAVGGEETHTLTTPEIPAHTHPNTLGTGHSTTGGSDGVSEANATSPEPNTGSAGGGGAHNNMQPFAVVNYLIRALP